MSEAIITGNSLDLVPAASIQSLEIIAGVEAKMRAMPQLHLQTEHVFHAGMYARTIRLAARVAITSVFIKIPTIIVLNGTCRVYAGESWHDLTGFNVIPANAGRKMIYVTATETQITMIFRSDVQSVEDAERQFTDDVDLLLSNQCKDDVVIITGVGPCQE